MSRGKSPFKFLDAFTYEDRSVFFGRDREITALYRLVQRAPLVLLYGLSGTGKTSLVQCGLASKFDGPDWFPIWIRRRTDLQKSLHRKLNNALPQPLLEGANAPDKIRAIYEHYLRPVYLIFDQLEELFTNGTYEERKNFLLELSQLVGAGLPCSIILSIREEYLGQLYHFEQAIPNLFDFRLRVEPMNNQSVKSVLKKSFQSFNIALEDPESELLDVMIKKISTNKERSEVELPYLQVYLDRLYRQDYERSYPEGFEGESWPSLEFTQVEIEQFGDINNVLDDFLRDQREGIQQEITQKFPQKKGIEHALQIFLDALVSDEGTKRPIRITKTEQFIEIDQRQRSLFEGLSKEVVTLCANRLDQARLMRISEETMELAHDILARLIDQQRSAKQRQLRDIRRRIAIAYDEHLERKHQRTISEQEPYFLDAGQISRIEPFLEESNLRPEWLSFIEASKAHNKVKIEKEQRRLEKELTLERKHKRRFRLISIVAVFLSLVALISFINARDKTQEAKANALIAGENAQHAQELSEKLKLKEIKEIKEFSNNLVERSDGLAVGDCCIKESIALLRVVQDTINARILRYELPQDSFRVITREIDKKINERQHEKRELDDKINKQEN